MATVELNACRNELARDILATDDLDVLRTTRRAYRRAMQRRNLRMMELEKNECQRSCSIYDGRTECKD